MLQVGTFPSVLLALASVLIGWPGESASGQTPSADKPEAAKYPNPQTAVLEAFVGRWNFKQDHIDSTGRVTATAKGTEDISWVLDQHAIRRDYTTTTPSGAYSALGFLVWNNATKQYDGVWFDNVSIAGPTTLNGAWEEKSRTMTFSAEGPDGAGGRQHYKVIERFESDSTRIATTYLIRGSEVVKVVEVRYERAAPCPDKLRIIRDE